MGKMRTFDDFVIERLRENPKFRTAYLNGILSDPDEDPRVVLTMLRHVVEAEGGMGMLARKTRLNRQSLYKTLSSRGNPEYTTVQRILRGLGYDLQIVPIKKTSLRSA